MKSACKRSKGLAIGPIALLFLITLVPTSIVYAQDNLGSWKTYTNEDYGYTVTYPPEWTLGDEDTVGLIVDTILSTVNIGLEDKGSDSKITELEFRVQMFPDKIQNLEELRNHRISQLSEGKHPDKIINYSSTTLDGRPAFKIFFERPEQTILEGISAIPERKVMSLTTFDETSNEAFIISYFAHPVLFDEYIPTVDKIIKSFHFTGK